MMEWLGLEGGIRMRWNGRREDGERAAEVVDQMGE